MNRQTPGLRIRPTRKQKTTAKSRQPKAAVKQRPEPIIFTARPYVPQRDGERVSRYHTELLLLQNELWRSLSSLPNDPQEMRRALERRQEGANWVRQLRMMSGRGEGTVLMLDAPGGEPAGYVFVTESFDPLNYERMGVIGELFVEEAWRSRGAGSQMLRAAEKWLMDRGVRSFQVFVTKTNAEAVDLYRNNGYATFDYRMVKRLST
ncbi:MAG: GNAT family N-acetyltransferase [Firmicutes bacterium]|nr:GNAT family N-acetyltransferase [Bacillota bacterium]